jgi:hypothetical protein
MGFPTKEGVVRESVYFNGYKYNRYPESKKEAHRKYFTKSGGRGLLHRHVWEFYNGAIPDKCQIHHKDKNYLNNDISNLECLSVKDHKLEHIAEIRERATSPERLVHLANIRGMAAAWHGSAEGLAWHSSNSKKSWESRVKVEHTCKECGTKFESLKTSRIYYCSGKCSATVWRREHPDYYTAKGKASRL